MKLKSSLFLPRKKYIVYNLCLVLIPVILLTGLFSWIMVRHVTDEMVRRYQVELEQKCLVVDERLNSFAQMVAYASVDSDLTPFNLRQNSYETVTALQHMRQLASAQGDSLIFFYVNSDDNLYSPTGKLSKETFYREYTFEGNWTREKFEELLNSPSTSVAAPLDCTLKTVIGEHRYMVVVYPWRRTSVRYGAGVCLIPFEWLEGVLYSSDSSPLYVMDSDGNTIGRQGSAEDGFFDVVLGSDSETVKHKGETWQLVRTKSGVVNWEYLTAVSRNEIRQMMYGGRLWLFPVLMFITLMCVALGVILAMRYYRPVSRLGMMLGSENSEIDRVHEKVSDIMKRNLEMEQSLEETQENLMYETVAKLLWNGLDDETCQELLRKNEISLGIKPYNVLVIDTVGRQGVAESGLLGLLKESGIPAALSPHSGYIAAILSTLPAKTARQRAYEIMEALLKTENMTVRMGVSSPTELLSSFGTSYIEAIAALKETAMGEVCCFDEIIGVQSKLVDRNITLATVHLSEAVSLANENAVNEACRELETLLENAYRETDQVVYRFTQNAVLKDILPCIERSAPDDLSWKLNLAMHALKPAPFMEQLRTLCLSCAQSNKYRMSTQLNRQMAQILEYIDANFTDQSLSQTGTAERFSMSTAGLSRMFSESLGVLFVDYVSQKRMAYGAELLASTDLSVKEIVEKVGYIDISSFSRKFSKMYGMSPTAYRKQYKA